MIPKFKKAEHAIAYGKAIRGDEWAINELEGALMARDDITDGLHDEAKALKYSKTRYEKIHKQGAQSAFKGQLLRDALREAKKGK